MGRGRDRPGRPDQMVRGWRSSQEAEDPMGAKHVGRGDWALSVCIPCTLNQVQNSLGAETSHALDVPWVKYCERMRK